MKRNLMGYFAVRSGIARILRIALRRRLAVLAYHRIGGPTSEFDELFDDSVSTCTAEVLDKQLAILRRLRTVVTLDQVCDALDGLRPLPPRAALITFDDATQDHYSRAFPILKSHGLTAVFFVSTRALTERTIEWWNLLGIAMKKAAEGSYDLGSELGGIVKLSDSQSRQQATRLVAHRIKSHSDTGDALHTVVALAAKLGIELPDAKRQTSGLITEAQLIEMHRAGMTIGSHSHSHAFLSRLSPAQQYDELQRSKKILEDLLQCPVRSLAYPYGQAPDYDQLSLNAARQAGYHCAFNLQKRHVVDLANTDRFDIDRFPVVACADYRFIASISAIAAG